MALFTNYIEPLGLQWAVHSRREITFLMHLTNRYFQYQLLNAIMYEHTLQALI